MSDGKQESEKIISSSKLSATVPAFVPGIAYTGPTSPGDLVINSNLSPLVPEFKPSVPFPSYVFPPYKPTHNFQYQYYGNQLYVQQKTIETQQNAPFQAHQTSISQSKKNSTKRGKNAATKKIEEQSERQNSLENPTGENLTDTDSSVNTKKKRRNRKKKEPSDSTPQNSQEESNTECLTEVQTELTVVTVKDDASGAKHEHASLKASKQCSSLEQNSTTSHSSLNSSYNENTKDSKTPIDVPSVESISNTDEQCNKKQHTTPIFTMSYSEKVKSLASKNNNSHLGTEKSFVKNFVPETSTVKGKHTQNSQYHSDQETLVNGETSDVKGGKRTQEKRGYYRLKESEPSKLQAKNVEQITRTERQMRRNNSFKKMTCDSDDNWRVKGADAKVTVDGIASGRTETQKKSNLENLDTESLKKSVCQEVDGDSKKVNKGSKHKKHVGQIVVTDEAGRSSKKQQNSCEFGSGSTANEACTKLSSSSSDVQRGSQRTLNTIDTISVAPTNTRTLEGEFPNLRDSLKIKSSTALDKRKMDHEELISPPKPSAPMSYSAVLRSAPKPKPLAVSPAWESEQPTNQGGLLKVPPQTTTDDVEYEAETEGSKQKKKKKKKKKKTKDTGDKPPESTSSKRTEKPIQFDLGVMLQTISVISPDKKQSPKKHVISTGVLPSQLSAASTPEVKPSLKNVQLLKKKENQAPHNVLDSTAPVVKRGKERETPARKKPSAMKKIILKEREEKKKAREGSTGEADKENEICQGEEEEEDRTHEPEEESITLEDMQSPSEEDTLPPEPSSPTDQEIAAKIHSRKFREYCFQVPDKEVDTVATELLRELVRFQDRQFQKDPVKAKAKRRFVLGLREVSKHLKLRKLKCVIISSNVERIKSAGGLDDTLSGIISSCQELQIPVVFALRRQLLGRVLLKKVPVSIVGIFNYDGAQEHFKKLIDLTQKTRQAYTEKWEEIREKLELQQKENPLTAETDKVMVSDGEETGKVPDISMEDATINHYAEATESSEDDDGNENCGDGHNETDAVIIENDLEIYEI